ncbi:MAG TPA: ABC transporter ATP-binding protein [Candidatus Andersenbacteria bacterium]|nr:ABC transporter ATP-binding protein [Candidatus Andersenbacteria bacterium]
MISALRDLWWLTKSCRKLVVFLLVAALVQQALQLVLPVAVGLIVDITATNNAALIRRQTWRLVGFLVGGMAAEFLLHFFVRHAMVRLIHRARGSITAEAFDHLLRLPVSFHENRDTGSKTKTIQNGADKVINLTEDWALMGMPVVFSYLLSTSLLHYYWWPAGIILGLGMPSIVAVSVLFYRLGKRAREERHDCYDEVESLLIEGIQNVATVQSYRMEESHSRRMRHIWQRVYRLGHQEMVFADIGFALRNIGILTSIGTVLWLGLFAVAEGYLSGGTLIVVIFLMLKMMHALWSLGQIIDQSIHNAPALRRLCELFSIQPEIQEQPEALRLAECRGELVFEAVSFRYPGTETNAVQDFSLVVHPGSTVALVGPSGAGKSTVFKLARRFIDPTGGTVNLDGQDLRNLALDFRQYLAVVSQEIEIFSDTIANNIAAGRTDLSRSDIEHIAEMACIDDFVRDLPNGYDTKVGERGIKLSGGQRQRLAIARALAVDCPIILFDEATSHLDAASEVRIQEAMQNLMGNRTMLIIAHRLSTVRHADRIIVMERGRIAEEGTHESLRRLEDGLYRKHLRIQSA